MYNHLVLSAAIALTLLSGSFVLTSAAEFKPAEYSKKIATCKAAKRTPQAEVVDINLSYVDVNSQADNSILMVHGWPGLWSTWSNQIQEFENDYHLVVPDLRGFGESEHPGDVRTAGTMGDFVGDLVCVLQHANVRSAICMGHDWGSQICYEAARMRPDIFTAVIGAVVPYIPAGDTFMPTKALVGALPKLSYQLYFDNKLAEAVVELDRDIRRTMRATLRSVSSPPPDKYLTSPDSFLEAWAPVQEIPPIPFFTPEEEDYLIQQFSIRGFIHTLQFYMSENRHASWEFARAQGNHSIPQPTLAVYPLNDPVADWVFMSQILKSGEHIPKLTVKTMEGAHWVHMENPVQFNVVVREWLRSLNLEVATDKVDNVRVADEL